MKKLKIQDLKVQSFITSLNRDEVNTVKGGDCPGNSANAVCDTAVAACQSAANPVCRPLFGGTCGGDSQIQFCSTCPVEFTEGAGCEPC